MADFVAVLRKTLDGLGETSPEMRARVYEKARATVESKLAAINPPPPPAVADRQRASLEEAIVALEAEYAPPPPLAKAAAPDPLTELENVFASIGRSRATPTLRPVGAGRDAEPGGERALPASERRAEPIMERAEPRSAFGAVRAPERKPASDPAAEPLGDVDVDIFDDLDEGDGDDGLDRQEPYEDQRLARRGAARSGYGGLIAATVVLALLAGGGYAAWQNSDALSAMLGNAGVISRPPEPAAAPPAGTEVAAAPVESTPAEPPAEAAPAEVAAAAPVVPVEPAAAPAATDTPKFTQRLSPDGSEADAGPAGGAPLVGEGTSVAALTQPGAAAAAPAEAQPADPAAPAAETAAPAVDPAAALDPALVPADSAAAAPPADVPPAAAADAPADPAAPAPDPTTVAQAAPAEAAADGQPAPEQVAVGQRAIFYEERTNTSEGSAETGAIVWSLVQESPGDGQPPEPAIRAEATIPGKELQLRMTIRRNADKTLPASHIVEMIFLTPETFEGGGIDNVLRVSFKGSEQETGSPLIGMPAKIADGFFLVALNDTKPEMDANLSLLQRQSWIDVPIVYKSGRRALFTMEKGLPGEKVFADAIKAWEAASG